MAKTFEELVVWQDAGKPANLVYLSFQQNQDYGFRNQISNAAVSVMNNTAEGLGRYSRAESKRFLQIAKASDGEVCSMSCLAHGTRNQSSTKAQKKQQ